jgi:spore maturation protein CgeB
MKIMVVGPIYPDSFAENVAETLRRMGHTVLAAGPAKRGIGVRRADHALSLASERLTRLAAVQQRHIVAAARTFAPEVTITMDRRLDRRTIDQLHSLGSPVYLWFPDAVSNLGRHDVFLAGYDRIYFKNPDLVSQLSEIQGLPVRYLPEACNSEWHRSDDPYGQSDHIAVVGNVHPTRAALLSRLVSAKVPIRIFGHPPAGWVGYSELRRHHVGHGVRRQEKAAVFRSAAAVLNNLHPAEFSGTNCRLFEATASGALVLTEERQGLRDLFDVGSEVVTFASFDELVDRYRETVANPEWARGIADAAARRSHNEHTYEHRLSAMLKD